MSEKIGEKAARSTVYLLIRRIAGYIVRFAAIAVLSRRLSVGEFGVVAIATTCINIMVVFGAAGIDSFVIYDRNEGWERRAKSAWWLNIAFALGQSLIASALVPLVVVIYGDRELVGVLFSLIITFFIEQLRSVPDSLLERKLDFRVIAVRDVANDVLTGVLGVAMALTGWGVWSLVLPRLVLSPLMTVATFKLAAWTPGWRLYREEWRGIFKYTINLIGSGLLHVIANDGDTIIVGKVLGETAAGFYNTGYMLANLVGRNVTAVLVQVSMPALGKIKDATGVLGPSCVRMYRFIGLVATPMLAGMFAIADDLVLLLFGPKWLPVTTLLRLFIFFTMVRSVTSPSGAIFNVVGRTDLTFKLSFVMTPLIIAAVVVGSFYGVGGVAVGVTIVRVVMGIIAYLISLKIVSMPLWAGVKAMIPSTLASASMTMLVWTEHVALQRTGLPLALRLVLCVATGAVAYLALLRLVSRAAFMDLGNVIGRVSPRLKRAFKFAAPAAEGS